MNSNFNLHHRDKLEKNYNEWKYLKKKKNIWEKKKKKKIWTFKTK